MSSRSEVRRGEKVPAAVGTVGNRLVGLNGLTGLDDQRTGVGDAWAKPAAGRTGELVGQIPALLAKEGVEGALGQPVGGGLGDGLQSGEVEDRDGRVVGGYASGDNLAPLAGQITEFLEVLRR